MIIETFDSKQTYELGYKLGFEAKAGDIYFLTASLELVRQYLHKALPRALE